MKTDVIIVGAGPTGLFLACQLLRYGVDFVIFDKKDGVTDLSKALGVHARTLEIYDQIGLAKTAVENGEIVQKVVLLDDGEAAMQLDISKVGGQLSPFPFVLFFEQSKNERLLADYLRNNGGGEVRWQTELENLSQDEDGVTANVKTADGAEQTIRASYLVGCDGAGSRTRKLLNLGFEGSTHPRLFYVADVEAEIAAENSTVYAAFGSEATVLMFPMKGEKQWRIVGNLPQYDEQAGQDVAYETIETKIKELFQRPLDITRVNWFSTYKVHTRHVESFSHGRCFLAGDAAHVHTPVGGQGMNTGIQDAYNLAWKLALVLQGKAEKSLLETYNEERLPNAKRLVQTTDQAFEILAKDRWYIRFFRESVLPILAGFIARFDTAKEFIFPMISQIGINYRAGSLSSHQGDKDFKVKAGDRMPYFPVDEASVYDSLREPKFHLLAFADAPNDFQTVQEVIKGEFENWMDYQAIPLSPRITEIFGADKPFTILLRPDNYIALISQKESLIEIENYLNSLFIKRSEN